MSNIRVGLAALLACAAGACVDQTLIATSTNAIIIHAVLDANDRDQYVLVQQTFGSPSTQARSRGAVVTITTPSGKIMVADEIVDSTRVITSSNEPPVVTIYKLSLDKYGETLQPGGTYTLHVAVQSWTGEIRGTTVVPGAPAMVASVATTSFARLNDTLSLGWHMVPFANRYEVSVSAASGSYGIFADTSLVLPGSARTVLGNPVFWPGVANTVTVSAVDANYYDYYRKTTDSFTPSAPVNHLEGAIGLFGSISRVRSQVLLVK